MKKQRHSSILTIIANQEIANQEELINALSRLGYSVTQATISRDINELQLTKKITENGSIKYTIPDNKLKKEPYSGMINFFKEAVIGADYGLNTAVIKCNVGMAMAACARLDEVEFNNIIGTLAGDDTIFILFKTEKEAKEFSRKINEIISK